MSGAAGGIRAAEVARAVGGHLHGDPDRPLRAIRALADAGPEDLSFLANPRYLSQARASRAAVILCGRGASLGERERIEADDPYRALAAALHLFHPPRRPAPGVDSRAAVGAGCRLGSGVTIGPFAVLGDGCNLGDGVVVGPGAVLGDGVSVGEGSVVHPGAVIYAGCRLGCRVIVHSGVVIGADGFGYASQAGVHHKVPQVGSVVVEDDVEIGPGTTIDRGTLESTRIGAGSKLDDQVMVAHNVVVGPGSLLVAQSGIAGSTRLGSGVVLAGQSGVAGHLELGDGARVAAKSAVFQDVPAGSAVAGIPAGPLAVWRRAQAVFARLPEVLRRLRRLERAPGGAGEDDGE